MFVVVVGSATTGCPPVPPGGDFFFVGAELGRAGAGPGCEGGPRCESEDKEGDTLPNVGDADFLPKGCGPKRVPALSEEADEDGDKLRMAFTL